MKRLLTVICLLIWTGSAHAAGQVEFSELVADVPVGPEGDRNGDGDTNQGDEAAEFINSGNEPVSLNGWFFTDRHGLEAGLAFTFLDVIIQPNERILVFGGGDPDVVRPNFPGIQVFFCNGKIGGNGISNTNDIVYLVRPDSTIADSMSSSQIAGGWNKDQSVVRYRGELVLHSTLPGIGRFSLGKPRRLVGDVTGNYETTAYDASHVLQHAVGLRALTGDDSTAADVSGQMGISAYDASLILMYVIDKISVFPVEQNGVPDPVTKSLMSFRTISLGELTLEPDNRYTLPILIDEMAGVLAGELTLTFTQDIKDVTVSTTDLTQDYLLYYNLIGRKLLIALASPGPVTGSGPILELTFDKPIEIPRIKDISFNEGQIPARIIKEVTNDMSMPSRVFANYPNPFNPQTRIHYPVNQAGYVELTIYSQTGQHIRALVDDEMPVGSFDIIWNGRDDIGQPVASGIYFCRLAVNGIHTARKMLLLR